MILLKYEMEVAPRICTVDKYFHLQFRQYICPPSAGSTMTGCLPLLKSKLKDLSRQHKGVTWRLELLYRKKTYVVTAFEGNVNTL